MQMVTPFGVPPQSFEKALAYVSENACFLVGWQLRSRAGTTRCPAGMGLGSQQVGEASVCQQGSGTLAPSSSIPTITCLARGGVRKPLLGVWRTWGWGGRGAQGGWPTQGALDLSPGAALPQLHLPSHSSRAQSPADIHLSLHEIV